MEKTLSALQETEKQKTYRTVGLNYCTSNISSGTFSVFNFPFQFPIPHSRFSNIHACGKHGVCNMGINK